MNTRAKDAAHCYQRMYDFILDSGKADGLLRLLHVVEHVVGVPRKNRKRARFERASDDLPAKNKARFARFEQLHFA